MRFSERYGHKPVREIIQLRVHGLARALGAIRFPLQGGYVTVSQLASEGRAIGTITLGGLTFNVSISLGPIPNHD
jgi:hypothetical protein